jgi:hypothetical protein
METRAACLAAAHGRNREDRMGNESLGDIRVVSPEEHWAHFARAWVALKTYTYLGKRTPSMDAGAAI